MGGVVNAVEHNCKLKTTRQALQKQTRIKTTFAEVKVLVSGKTSKATPKFKYPLSLKVAAERLKKLGHKVACLEAENKKFLEQFHVWLYNANINNISIEPPLTKKGKWILVDRVGSIFTIICINMR
ncbi:hypothetical protein [Photorhabdus namnaonensis]|uniref:Uncharacterized protein n=1 Tax=Photorhabdus namnaonensis TaxID=1851568 RepID=A0A1B8YF88_9GAMM|nr:hypothetical protein [Photorhabdus namnaonensis]OCA53755.1 hypothetical protein Phpb_03307 [Photorhabdus namnaonensis]